MTDELKHAVERLRSLSPKLNKATDDGNATIQLIEKFLNDECKLGLPVYVQTLSADDGDGVYHSVGYDRVGGRYRVTLKIDDCRDENGKEVLSEDGQMAVTQRLEVVALADCPRGIKLRSLKYLPELLKNLASEAEAAIRSAEESTAAVNELMGVIGTNRPASPKTGMMNPLELADKYRREHAKQ